MTPKRHVIPVFVPHLGCPNDCVFCNQRRISGRLLPATPETVRQAVEDADFLKDDGTGKQLAFYGGSFTAIPPAEQDALLEAALPFIEKYKNAGIRISTRPDHIDEETLRRLKTRGVATIELGAQSMDDDVLRASGRGHTAADTVNAARLVRESGFELILQMMTGLPDDTPEKAIRTARQLIALRPDGVRIYPTVVIRDTKLHEMWLRGMYREHSVEDAVGLCANLYVLFEEAGIPIIRLGLNPTEELSAGDAIAGAYHPAFGELVLSRVFLNRARVLLAGKGCIKDVVLGVSPGRISAMTGHKRSNIEALRREFGIGRVAVVSADTKSGKQAAEGEIVIMRIDNRL
jgi:histone acetyltransferase (RNA polymerase elongator complex component)